VKWPQETGIIDVKEIRTEKIMGLSQMLNSKKGLIILVVVELVACIVLGAVVWKKQKEIKTSETFTNTLIEQVSQAEKVKGELDNLLQQIQSLKMTAGTIAMTSNMPMDRPDQICNVVKQILAKQQQALNSAAAAISAAKAEAASATSPTAEVDFLVGLVAKEIAGQGVVDTQQAEKFAVVLYHMQKVLDALGYKLNDTIKTTNQAVIKYQTDNQLKPDGKIGPKTWAKIRDAWNAKRPGGPMPTPAVPAAAQTKPQTQATTPVKPITTIQPAAPARPSLSSVTTRSSVQP
jgi:enamine deaminase RidA (YjgF/YER057c/UK114 family)